MGYPDVKRIVGQRVALCHGPQLERFVLFTSVCQ